MLKRRLDQGTLLTLALPCTDTKGVDCIHLSERISYKTGMYSMPFKNSL